jgi:hypothetical protein
VNDVAGEGGATGPDLELINEFAEVRVRKVITGNGARLEIVAPRVGTSVRLCPLELEALTRATPESLSDLLGSPGLTGEPS